MEEKIDAEYLKKLAHQLMFDLSDDEAAATAGSAVTHLLTPTTFRP